MTARSTSGARNTASCLIGGICLALCLPRPGLCPLAWFAIVPLLLEAARERSYRRAAFAGALFGFSFWGTALYWVYCTARFAAVPIPGALFAWAVMCLFFSTAWASLGMGVCRLWKSVSPPVWPWACAVLWAAIEFIGDRVLPYAGAMPLEYTQWRYLSLVQNSSWAGPHALGFLVVLVNGVLALAMMIRLNTPDRRERLRSVATARFAAGTLLIWWGVGFWSLSGRPSSQAAGIFRKVAILQPNVDQYRKWDEKYALEIKDNISQLVEASAKEQPDLILWPETSMPDWLDTRENAEWLQSLFIPAKSYQLVGALTRRQVMNSSAGMPLYSMEQFNSAVLFDPKGHKIGEYHKRRLVPFGEFVPWRTLTSKFIGILDQMGDLDPGFRIQEPLLTSFGRLGVTVCFEAMFPDLSRTNTEAGADVLANLTNDGWYKDTWGPYQHFYANIFRAVENRRPVLRSANTGISGAIDPYGVVLQQSSLGQRGVLMASVPVGLFPKGSFYAQHGDWFGWLCLLVCVAMFMRGLAAKKAGRS